MEYSTIKEFTYRGFVVPPGTACEWNTKNQCYYVKPRFFPSGSIRRHDAVHYGCRVEAENIKHIDDKL